MTRRGALARRRPAKRMVSAACAAVLLACGGLCGCTTQADLDGSSSPSLTPSSSDPETIEPAETATRTGAPGDVPCAGNQRRVLKRMRMYNVIDPVTASTTGSSIIAGRQAHEDAGRAAERLRAACGFVPRSARHYVREVRRLTATTFDHRQLDLLLEARLQWARTLEAEKSAALDIRGLRACRALKDDVAVSYRVWWRWTETGRAWWVELTWDNRTGATINGARLNGAVRVNGLLEDAFGWSASASSPGPGRDEILDWGASSADTAWVEPGFSRLIVAPGADQDVHTNATGTFDVTDLGVSVYSPRLVRSCALPVRPGSADR